MDEIQRRLVEQVEELSEGRVERNARIAELENKLRRIKAAADDYLAGTAGGVSPDFVLTQISNEAWRALRDDLAGQLPN